MKQWLIPLLLCLLATTESLRPGIGRGISSIANPREATAWDFAWDGAGNDGVDGSTPSLVLLRHGETLFNAANKFCGWMEPPLTEHGRASATAAGELLALRDFSFDTVYTSQLNRAVETAELCLDAMQQRRPPLLKDWRLNERHYGALQGLEKDSPALLERFGAEAVNEWRRSYTARPPPLEDPQAFSYAESCRRGIFAESLRDCEARVRGVWAGELEPSLRAGRSCLVVAHANTLRSLIKVIDGIGEQDIRRVWVPNCVPLVYPVENLRPRMHASSAMGGDGAGTVAALPRTQEQEQQRSFQGEYIVTPSNIGEVADTYGKLYDTSSQGSLLRTLFDSLDLDGDGYIDSSELRVGMLKCPDPDVLQTLYSYDIDGDGRLSYEEFVVCLSAAETRNVYKILT